MKYNDQAVFETILDKTKQLLMSRGVKGWNMDQLAYESGLAKNTLYKIIGSKENAIVEAMIRDINRISMTIRNVLLSEDTPPPSLETIAKMFCSLLAEIHGDYFNEVLTEYPGSAGKIKENKELANETVAAVIDIYVSRGVLRDDISGEIVHNIIDALITFYMDKERDPEIIGQKMLQSLEYMMTGIMKRDE